MQTYSGRRVWPLDPRPEDIEIVDVAHHLSNLGRFAGATRKFYSVGQHCVLASIYIEIPRIIRGSDLDRVLRMAALLHDAPEYVLVDVPRPLKRYLPEYKPIEALWTECIGRRFLGDYWHQLDSIHVKRVDVRLLATERRDLMTVAPASWSIDKGERVDAFPDSIWPWSPEYAEEQFLQRFAELQSR